jgi:ATP-dependent Clp protease ATP-binding subunit ClpA
MLERFTKPARQVVLGAREQARELGHHFVGTEHILLALLATEGSDPAVEALRESGVEVATVRADIMRIVGHGERTDDDQDDFDAEALRAIGIDPDAVRAKLEETFGAGAMDWLRTPDRSSSRHGSRRIGFTRRGKKVLELSLREAVRLHYGYIDTPHILLGLLREGRGIAVHVLRNSGVNVTELRRRVLASLDQAA